MASKKYQKTLNQPVQKQSNMVQAHSIQKNTEQPLQEKGFRASADHFFQKRLGLFFIVSLMLTVVLSIYLFDVKVHEGGDDSSYIEMAHRFIKGKGFPSFHGEFYSIFLALPMLIFGVNVVVLKIFSFLFIIGHLIFFFLTFKNRVSSTLLVFTMLIISVSANILFFASQTYSEALYMFLQSLSFFIAFRLIDKITVNKINYLEHWPLWISTGFLIFLLTITRNIGMALLMAIGAYFLFNKKYYAVIYLAASYLIFNFGFGLYKRLVWGIDQSSIAQQRSFIMLKDPYNAAKGVEDFSGMADRFFANIKMYLSRHFFASIGLRDPLKVETTYLPAIILIVIFLIALYFAFRKHKPMLLTGLYLGIAIATTFITLAKSWGQLRMIVIFIPLILLISAYGIYELSKNQKFRFLFLMLFILFVFIFFKTFGQSIKKAKENQKILSKNLAGNKYYGFTPDWVNFLKMSEWVGKNIPDSVAVASRKPSISFIYGGGKEFYGIYRMPTLNGDSIMEAIKKANDDVCIFNLNELNKNNVPAGSQLNIKTTAISFMAVGNEIYGIFDLKESYKNDFMKIINDYKIENFLQPELYMDYVHKQNVTYYGVQPDSLLLSLKKANVRYAILANLRMNPNVKTGNIISTVQRYFYFIEMKYPGILSLVKQIGGNDEEPSQLVMINYEKFGL